MQIWNNIDEDLWWHVVKSAEHSTFYHTPAWHRLIHESMPGSELKTIGGELENGTQFVLPMITTNRKGPFYGLVSSAEDVYGGITANGPITDAEQEQIYSHVIHNWQVISFRFLPAPYSQINFDLKDFHSPEVDTTFIICLADGFESISSNFSKSQRSNINKAKRAGIVVEQTNKWEDFEAFYQIYLDSVSRWDDDRIGDIKPRAIFEKAYELQQEMPEAVCLWAAKLDGVLISGALDFLWNKWVVGWLAANQSEYMSYGAFSLVLHESIKYYAGTNLTYFDLGGSGGNEGAHNFKKRFGGIQQPVNWWFYANPLSTSLHNWRHKFSRA